MIAKGSVTVKGDKSGNMVVQEAKTGKAVAVVVDGKSYRIWR
jgi:hypothetical protein